MRGRKRCAPRAAFGEWQDKVLARQSIDQCVMGRQKKRGTDRG